MKYVKFSFSKANLTFGLFLAAGAMVVSVTAPAGQVQSVVEVDPASQQAFCEAHSIHPCALSSILSLVEADLASDDLSKSLVDPAAALAFCEANQIVPCSGSALVGWIKQILQSQDLNGR